MLTASIAGIILLILLILAGIAVLAFELWMFIDALRNPQLTDAERVIWCVGMLLIHPFAAIAYYFMSSTKRTRL